MRKSRSGFTIVELLVVIAVIGILTTISLISFTRYQASARDSQRTATINVLAEALEKYYDANGEYPSVRSLANDFSDNTGQIVANKLNLIPNDLKTPKMPLSATNGVTSGVALHDDYITYVASTQDTTDTCQTVIDGGCDQFTMQYLEESGNTITINSRHGVRPTVPELPPTLVAPDAPLNLVVVSTTTTQINLSWTAVTGATSYTAQCASDDVTFVVNMKQSTQSTTTGSVSGLNSGSLYYCHVRATNGVGNSAWSASVTATTAQSWTWTERTGASEPDGAIWYGVASSADGTKLVASAFSGFNGDPSLDWNDLWTSTNSGVTWTRRNVAGVVEWRSIASSADGVKLVAVATMNASPGDTALWTSTNSGVTWTQRTATTTKAWTDVASSSDGTKLVAVNQDQYLTGTLWTSTNSGVTWTQRAAAGNDWYGVASSADGTKLVAVDFGGYVYTSTDSGITWTQRPAAGSRGWRGVASSADGTKLVAVPKKNIYGANVPDYIFTSTDSGVTWTQRTSAGAREWIGAASSSDGTKLVASSFGPYLLTSADSGATWTEHTATGARQAWYRVASSADGNKIIGAPYSSYLWTGVFGP